MRILSIAAMLAVTVASSEGTTLQKLTLDDMIRQSTAIVRAKVSESYAAMHGSAVYTYYKFQITETLKDGSAALSEVAIPGGVAKGLRQMVPGAPALATGQEYVVFLWTSKSGLTQIIGLSQGLFQVSQDASGNPVLIRPAVAALMLDAQGNPVSNPSLTMSLSSLRSEIQKVQGQ